ncbi:hypothetical protein D9756_000255 [Leucocoprinus leucothites]|uniref:Uncharacterized protein n=1 Tax=Leucocoprinus leucothites TaxID=201217 RepID=A0A8H5GFS9_9AGAR|nr:hypothetical protein D9756_000255 [Leucoagaricus leucothites]
MAPVLDAIVLMGRAVEKSHGTKEKILLDIWIYFNLIGNTILLPLVVITFLFSKTAKRHPTLINLCITWIFSGVFSLLLFYAKEHIGPEPHQPICYAQASLLYGITPMWAVAVLALFSYMLHTLSGEPNQSRYLKSLPMIVMLSAPYIAQCAFTIAALLLANQNPSKVRRNSLFCSFGHHQLQVLFVFCVFIIGIEVALAVVIYRSWRTMRSIGLPSDLPLPLMARVFIFGVYVAVGMVVSILGFFRISLPGSIYAATAGTVVFLIFGTQADVLRAWCFWRKDNSPPPTIRPPLPVNMRSRYASSLDAVFRSYRPESNFPWSNRSSRTHSQPSTHRISTKHFTRLPDDAEVMHVHTGRSDPMERSATESHLVGMSPAPEMTELPEPALTRPRREGVGEPPPVDGLERLDTRRRRRRDDPPRPKGPRNASYTASVRTPSVSVSASPRVRAL